ncbi:MAG: AAA family ATPase [Nannocystaceae bacterium]
MSDRPVAVQHRLIRTLRGGTRAIVLEATDEHRALRMLEEVGEEVGWPVQTWSATLGVEGSGTSDLGTCLQQLAGAANDGLWVLLDAPASLQTAHDKRALRELALRTHGPAVVFLSAQPHHLPEIPELVYERLALPDREEIDSELADIANVLREQGKHALEQAIITAQSQLASALVGFDLSEIERVVAEALSEFGSDSARLVTSVLAHKSRALHRNSALEPIEAVPTDEVGGMHNLKRWLSRRAVALAPEAAPAGIPWPRGVLLVGIQGCGKSLAARACADILRLPLFRLDPGRLFGGTVGQSEANLRRVLDTVDRLAPVVLWLDEIDKGLAGSDGAASDAGTTARVVGGLLTWLQERQRPAFVVATANRIDALPPELLRRGRLDETFFVDLPRADEREAILRVHLAARPARVLGQAPPYAGHWDTFSAVARDAEGFSGAELEAALVEARLDAFAEARCVSAEDLRTALAATVPLSRSHERSITALRQWAEQRARIA